MNQASLLGCVSLGAECRKVLMLVVCFVLNETKLTSNGVMVLEYVITPVGLRVEFLWNDASHLTKPIVVS